jgi:hypothetical protein
VDFLQKDEDGSGLTGTRFDSGMGSIWITRSRSDGCERERRGGGAPATGNPPASGGAQTTPASRLDLGLRGTVCDEVCTEAKLATQRIDLWHSGRRAGDGGGEPLGEVDNTRRRTLVSAHGRCGARARVPKAPQSCSPACATPGDLHDDGTATDDDSQVAVRLGFWRRRRRAQG